MILQIKKAFIRETRRDEVVSFPELIQNLGGENHALY